jgi:transcription elongation factor GreA
MRALMTFSGGRWPSGPYGGIVERDVLLTQEGYEKLQEELQSLSTDKRREVADRIRVAREFGDISENSEFDDAKNEQMMLEKQIAKLEERLRSARIIDPSEADAGAVDVGLQVTVKDVDRKRDATYRIVGSAEADPSAGRLSNESPVGRALMGRKKGETIEVSVPAGVLKLKIVNISVPA